MRLFINNLSFVIYIFKWLKIYDQPFRPRPRSEKSTRGWCSSTFLMTWSGPRRNCYRDWKLRIFFWLDYYRFWFSFIILFLVISFRQGASNSERPKDVRSISWLWSLSFGCLQSYHPVLWIIQLLGWIPGRQWKREKDEPPTVSKWTQRSSQW